MSEWTIKLPLVPGEMLYVDMEELEIEGYRVDSDDPSEPQVIVGEIDEAIAWAAPGIPCVEKMGMLADLAASVADEIKAKKIQMTAWRMKDQFYVQKNRPCEYTVRHLDGRHFAEVPLHSRTDEEAEVLALKIAKMLNDETQP